MSSHVEQIKQKLGIVEVIGSYVELEKAGTNFKAKCPFHNEKSASFFVSPERNNYYCFGCGAKGDIISFVQDFEGLDFIGALRVLAKRAGVELTRENPNIRTERERLYLTMEYATLFFQRQLSENKSAQDYIKKRGLTEETIKEWRLGYSSVDWRKLYQYLFQKKISVGEMEKAGLVKRSEKSSSTGDSYYDRFRGRIMFPIFDSSGRVVAFSGRQFESDGTEAKYINSPETALFEKSKILYGFDRAKLNIRKQDFSLLVEGQMDLLMSHQAGFTNTDASSGTALTADHVEILRRLSNKIVIAYDGDKAGEAAATRGWQIALSLGLDVKIASLKDGKDPADVILSDPKIFADAVSKARHIIDVQIEKIVGQNLPERELKISAEKILLPYIVSLHGLAEQSYYIREIAMATKMKEDLLWDIVKKMPKTFSQDPNGSGTYTARKIFSRKDSIARMLFGLVFLEESSKKENLKDLDIRKKICKIIPEEIVTNLATEFGPVKDDLIFEAEALFTDSASVDKHFDELVFGLKEELLREELSEAMRLIQASERHKDNAKTAELLKRCQEISIEIRNITKRT